ncbi:MAG: DUF3450 family protein [Fibrobacterota bacterium]
MKRFVWVILCALPLSALSAETDEEARIAALQEDIGEYQQRISQVEREIQQTEEKIQAQQKRSRTYSLRMDSILDDKSRLKDSLSKEIRNRTDRRDSLGGRATALENSRALYEGRQRRFRRTFVSAVTEMDSVLVQLPPQWAEKHRREVQTLGRDVRNGTLSPAEGVDRLRHIHTSLSADRFTMEHWSGRAPKEAMDGRSRYLRIGFAWYACISEDGRRGAWWDRSARRWQAMENAAAREAVDRALRMRDGMEIPGLTRLPLFTACTDTAPAAKDTSGEEARHE